MMGAAFRVVHTHGVDVTVLADLPAADPVAIARYVYEPDPDPFECPKPYLHPMRSLAGDVVTGYRPHDHRWHKGLQMTATDVSGYNLWGGNTYVHGTGYVKLDNVGAMAVDGPVHVGTSGDRAEVSHALVWTAAGESLAAERRCLVFHGLDTSAGVWLLDWSSDVRNVAGRPLEFGSPTTRGRPNAGYTGLMWRGPRSFTGGVVVTPQGAVEADDFRGKPAGWLAFIGDHDDVDRSSTLVFHDGTDAPNPVPADWFVRTAEFATVNPSWAFHKPFTLEPGESFRRDYRVAIYDHARDLS